MLEPKVDQRQLMQCLGCSRWRYLPPGIRFCRTEPFNRNRDMPEVIEIRCDPVSSISNVPAAANKDYKMGEDSFHPSKSNFKKFCPIRKRNWSEIEDRFSEIAHQDRLDYGGTFFPKKTKYLQTSINSFFPRNALFIQTSIEDLFPKKTKYLQKRIKDFFPNIKCHETMRTVRQSRVNGIDRDTTNRNS